MTSPAVRRLLSGPKWSLVLSAVVGLGFGCSPGETTPNTGTGGSSSGSGGSGSGTGGSSSGTGGSSSGTGGSSSGPAAAASDGRQQLGHGRQQLRTGGSSSDGRQQLGHGRQQPARVAAAPARVAAAPARAAAAPARAAAAPARVALAARIAGCSNTNMDMLNLDASGYVCNNKWGIKGAWYCYSDGSDSANSCKGSDGKGAGAIPWNQAAGAMCLSGTMGTGTASTPASGSRSTLRRPAAPPRRARGTRASIVGFAITLSPGASGKGSGGHGSQPRVSDDDGPRSEYQGRARRDAPRRRQQGDYLQRALCRCGAR